MARDDAIHLRAARPDEALALGELCLRSKAVWGYDYAFLEACRNELQPSVAAIAAGDVCVAERDGVVVGVAEVSAADEVAHLEKLFVEPHFIRKGIGDRLMDWVADRAAALGAKSLVIEADPDAAAFYRRRGARDEGLAPSGSIPGRMLPRLVLHLGA